MFTGIIEAFADIKGRTCAGLTVGRPAIFDDIKAGSSISVSGVCLSAVSLNDESITFDVVPETWECTNLGFLKVGGKVNLERAMKASDRFEGHIVQGHVEGVGIVTDLRSRTLNKSSSSSKVQSLPAGQADPTFDAGITFTVPDVLTRHIVPKGSIAVDGVSLTVVSIEGSKVTVALIPHTMKNTTLGLLDRGDKVNIETDVLIRHAWNILVAQI